MKLLIICSCLFALQTVVQADEQLEQLNQQLVEYYQLGDYPKATNWAIKVLAYSREYLGTKHKNTLTSMNNLAFLYDSQGQYDQAEPLYIEALALSRKVLGAKHPSTLTSINNLAILYKSQGRYEQAKSLYIATLDLRKEVLGNKHPSTLASINNLASLYESQGRYDLAEPLYIETLDISKEVLGTKHPDTLTSMNNLAGLYQSQGRYDQAEPLYIETLDIIKEVLGTKHPNTLASMNNLALLYRFQGLYDQAETLFIESLDILKEVQGAKHPNTLTSMDNLAGLYQSQGRYDQAEPRLIETLDLRKEVLGTKHPDTLDSTHNLAILYESQGRYDLAGPLYIETLDISKQVLGAKHPSTLLSMHSLASLYESQGLYDLAGPLYIETLDLRKEVLGTNHPSTLSTMNGLAGLYKDQGQYDQAEPLYIETLNLRKKVLGTKHPSTLASMNNLAGIYQLQERYGQAEPLYIETLDIIKEVLGTKHPSTLTTMNNLANLYRIQGRYDQAEVLSDEALSATQAFLTQVLWAAGEKTRGSYILQQKNTTDFYLSLFGHRATDANARRSLALSLNRKALLLQISSQIRAVSRSSDNPALKELATSLKSNRKRLSALVLAGKSARVELQALEERINQQQAELGRHVQQLRRSSLSVTPQQVIQALDDQSVFVDFLVYRPMKDYNFQPEHLLALVVSRDQDHPIRILNLGEMAPIRLAIEQYRKILGTPNRLTNHDKVIGQQLYQSLWSPLVPYLKEKRRVYLAPDGILNLLPFTSLIDEAGRYIVSQNDVIMLSSGRDLVLPSLKAEVTAPVILAAPLFDAAQTEQYAAGLNRREATTTARSLNALYFSPLVGTLKEGDDLAAQLELSQHKANYYKLAEATETIVKAIQSPRILHMATHGFFLEDVILEAPDQGLLQQGGIGAIEETPTLPSATSNPLLRAGLALVDANLAINAYAENVSGILTAEEVLDLQLAGTELVVLSACETGVGEIRIGEGVYGLRRAFQEAGAQSVLSTLWSISDEGTQHFMQQFYRRYLDGASPQQALRDTQMEFINSDKWKHPFFWAPFVMVGR